MICGMRETRLLYVDSSDSPIKVKLYIIKIYCNNYHGSIILFIKSSLSLKLLQ